MFDHYGVRFGGSCGLIFTSGRLIFGYHDEIIFALDMEFTTRKSSTKEARTPAKGSNHQNAPAYTCQSTRSPLHQRVPKLTSAYHDDMIFALDIKPTTRKSSTKEARTPLKGSNQQPRTVPHTLVSLLVPSYTRVSRSSRQPNRPKT